MKNNNLFAPRTIRYGIAVVLCLALITGCGKKDDVTPAVNEVTIINIDPVSPATLSFGEEVMITYDYKVVDSDGVRIWIQPYTNGSISPRYLYSSSPLFKGQGTKTVVISISGSDDTTIVDQLAIIISNADASERLSTTYKTVDYTYQ